MCLKSASKLFIISCLVLFNGLALAAESNKDKLKQMLDGTNKQQAVSSIPDQLITGHWVGTYDYNNRNAKTPPPNTFSMVMEKVNNSIVAMILEPDLNPQYYAQVAEVVNPRINGQTFKFTKKYSSGTTIDYSLEIDVSNRAMIGNWNIKNGPSGMVHMIKLEANELQ